MYYSIQQDFHLMLEHDILLCKNMGRSHRHILHIADQGAVDPIHNLQNLIRQLLHNPLPLMI